MPVGLRRESSSPDPMTTQFFLLLCYIMSCRIHTKYPLKRHIRLILAGYGSVLRRTVTSFPCFIRYKVHELLDHDLLDPVSYFLTSPGEGMTCRTMPWLSYPNFDIERPVIGGTWKFDPAIHTMLILRSTPHATDATV